METGVINVSRAARQATFPSRFQLIAAMNPCPCGYANDDSQICRCSVDVIRRYQARLSGPFLDRIDLRISLQREPQSPWFDSSLSNAGSAEESSSVVRARVNEVRVKQLQRQGIENARFDFSVGSSFDQFDNETKQFYREASESLQLSLRAGHRVLRVARTIADLDHRDDMASLDIAEAMTYRGVGL